LIVDTFELFFCFYALYFVGDAARSMSKYNECISSGKYSFLKAGEVCSIESAKTSGFFDAKNYYKGKGYKELRTYNPGVDGKTARSRGDLCPECGRFGGVSGMLACRECWGGIHAPCRCPR